MNDLDLDRAYGAVCRAMSRTGEDNAALFLARLVMLCAIAIDDADAMERLAAAAAEGIETAPINPAGP